jgi:hypothetical protein
MRLSVRLPHAGLQYRSVGSPCVKVIPQVLQVRSFLDRLGESQLFREAAQEFEQKVRILTA